MLSIGIDAQVLIWGVRGAATPGQEAMISIAQAFFEYAQTQHLNLMIPAPALAELLRGYEAGARDEVVTVLQSIVAIPPFDLKAARLAAEIKSERDLIEKLKPSLTKNCLSFDAMIVATALAADAKLMVSNDRGVRALAAGRLRVVGIEEFMAAPDQFITPRS